MRRTIATGLGLLLATTLVGCDQFLPEPFSFTVVDSVVVARTCIPLTISSQSISLYSGSSDHEGHSVWSASGEAILPPGTEFAIGEPIPGLEATSPLSIDPLTTRFKYEMDVDSGKGGEWTTFTLLDPGELAEGQWTDSYGRPVETPCTHEACGPMAACFNNWPEPSGAATEARPTFTPPVASTPTPAP
jgi:hypothetical protein